MKSAIMTKWESLKQPLANDYNIYSNNLILKDMVFPAIVFVPDNQVPGVDLASYANRILEYKWKLIILLRLSDYDDITEAQDDAWYLAETIPNLLKVKITNSVPFGHVKDNKELVCIELDVSSRI
jgi:hypothetical protein